MTPQKYNEHKNYKGNRSNTKYANYRKNSKNLIVFSQKPCKNANQDCKSIILLRSIYCYHVMGQTANINKFLEKAFKMINLFQFSFAYFNMHYLFLLDTLITCDLSLLISISYFLPLPTDHISCIFCFSYNNRITLNF